MSLTDTLQHLIRDHYVFESEAETIAGSVADAPTSGDPAAVAAGLTDLLRAASGDLHLRVQHLPDGRPGDPDGLAREHARRTNGGIAQVRLLDDGTGLLAITPYTARVDLAAPYVEAAFVLLRHVDHLVIDLREGFGGTPETVALVCGHLLPGDEPVHVQDVVGRREARQFWTTPTSARLRDDARVSVLTSARTFSGCEELAYDLQAMGRARVVGETTAGAAHPVVSMPLDDWFDVSMPTARSVNAVRGTNWEGVGVLSDEPCAAGSALDAALRARA